MRFPSGPESVPATCSADPERPSPIIPSRRCNLSFQQLPLNEKGFISIGFVIRTTSVGLPKLPIGFFLLLR